MSLPMTDSEPNALPYRYAEGQAFDELARSTSDLPEPVSFQSPLQISPWHIPSETGSVLDASTARFAHPEQRPHANVDDLAGPDDCSHGRGFFPSALRCDTRASNHTLDLPSALSPSSATSPKDMTDTPSAGSTAHSVIFTDDAKMKLSDRIRRQCFNCRATTTNAWRRSVLSPGKLVCNKCGLFERAHRVPRPATFLRRRRFQPTPVYQNMGHPFDRTEYFHHDGRPAQPFASHFPDPSTGAETSSQGMMWVNHGVLPTPSGLSSSYVAPPQPSSTIIHCTCPAEAASLPSHLGVFRHSPSVASIPLNDHGGTCQHTSVASTTSFSPNAPFPSFSGFSDM